MRLSASLSGGDADGVRCFLSRGYRLGTATLVGGAATLAVGGFPAGTESITATTMLGDPDFLKEPRPHWTKRSQPVRSSPERLWPLRPIRGAGQTVTLTATVSRPVHTMDAGRSVTFMDGTTTLGTLPILERKRSLRSQLAPGARPITVVYPGNSAFVGSVSSILVETIGQTSTKTRLYVLPQVVDLWASG